MLGLTPERQKIVHIAIDMIDMIDMYICQIINPAHHEVVGAGFDIARLTTKIMSSVSLNLLKNSTFETQNPRRDTNIPTAIAGLIQS